MANSNHPHRLDRALLGAGALIVVALVGLGLLRTRHPQPLGGLPAARADLQQMMQAQAGAVRDAQQRQSMQRQMLEQMQALQGQAAGAAPAAEPQPRVPVVRDSATAVQLAVTLPEGQVAGVTMTFQPGVPYTPTEAERAGQSQGRQVFGVRLTHTDTPEGRRVLLSYVVPADALPPELRQRVLGKPETAGPQLVRAAHAQALNTWTGLQTGYDLGKYGSGIKPKTLGKLYSNYKKVVNAWDSAEQYAVWMREFDAMERCARNPTQTVTQNAYQQDPAYQQRTLDAIQQARSEAQQAAGLGFVNQEASVAMQLTEAPGALRGVTDKVADWNNAALRDIGNQLVTDTGGGGGEGDRQPLWVGAASRAATAS